MRSQLPTQTNSSPLLNHDRSGILQRKCATCGQHTISGEQCSECQKKHLQRRTSHPESTLEAPSIVDQALNTSGQPLDRKTRTLMESRFNQDFSGVRSHTQPAPSIQTRLTIGSANHASEQEADRNADQVVQSAELPYRSPVLQKPSYDFSQVRVHTDNLANKSAQAINALAYTVDQDIVFRQGQYQPDTMQGQHLLAHELTHVIQQRQLSHTSTGQHGLLVQREATPATSSLDQFTAPLTDREWQLVEMWQSRGEVGIEALTEDANYNALVIADAIFCGRSLSTLILDSPREDPLLCVISEVTRADRRVQQLVPHITAQGPIINWARVDPDQRMVHVMELLINTYHFPENGAAGLVGNLWSESGVLPNRVEGSSIDTPMRARNRAGRTTDFTPEQVMNRDTVGREGPDSPGVGLAQWTTPERREGLFQHTFAGRQQGTAILFNMDAQVDYLVTELQARYQGVYNVLTRSGVSVNDASDEVVYRYEVPGSVLDSENHLLPRTDPAVQAVFGARRSNSQRALRALRRAHP